MHQLLLQPPLWLPSLGCQLLHQLQGTNVRGHPWRLHLLVHLHLLQGLLLLALVASAHLAVGSTLHLAPLLRFLGSRSQPLLLLALVALAHLAVGSTLCMGLLAYSLDSCIRL
jgi:hypothetical protein